MRYRRPRETGAVTMSSPVGLVYSPVAARSASERSARICFSAATYDRPESVSVSLRAERSKSLARRCSSSSVILRLAVAGGVLRRRAAAERLPASATASTIDMASRRSIARPFRSTERWVPVSPNRLLSWKRIRHGATDRFQPAGRKPESTHDDFHERHGARHRCLFLHRQAGSARNRPLPPNRVSKVGSDAHRGSPPIPLHHQEPLSS